MQWVSTVSKLYGKCYSIPIVDDLEEMRHLAGSITPAIITTTAITAGYMCLNFVKALMKESYPDKYLYMSYDTASANGFLDGPLQLPWKNKKLTHFINYGDIHPDLTVKELINWFKQEFEVTPISIVLDEFNTEEIFEEDREECIEW